MPEGMELPYSQEAEEALISSVFIRPELYVTLDIEPTDFFQVKHQRIWQAFGELGIIDYVTVIERLKAKNQLDGIGGAAYITGLMTSQASSMHAEEYAETVRDYARRRGLIRLTNDIVKAAFDTKRPIDESTAGFITGIVEASRQSAGAQHISGIVSDLYDEIEERSRNPQDVWGLPTKFSTFDRLTGGLQKSELMILSGEPGVGKSILGMQMGMQVSKTAPGVIYSMEMGAMQLARRMLSGEARVGTRSIKTGRLKNDDWSKITVGIEKLSTMNLFISDSSGWTTTGLRADLARLKAQHGIEWFVLDYLYLLNDGEGKDEIERTAIASKGLKQICMDLDLAGIAIHSMNKQHMGSDGIPGNQSLRGSGQVIYDADIITYLTKFKPMSTKEEWISEDERDNMRTFWFGKGRELEDSKKYFHMVKQPGYPIFAEYEKGV